MVTQNKRMALVCAGLVVSNMLIGARAQAQDVSFEEAQSFAAGRNPWSVAVADFNGDGRQDLAVADFDSNTVSVLLGNGDGSFQAAQFFGVGLYPFSVAVGDYNGDGLQDLAIANRGSDTVSVLLGNGDGSFQPPQDLEAGNGPVSVAVADFNGDGLWDLAVADSNSNNVLVLLGNGDGTFQAAQVFEAGAFGLPQSVAVGDFNNDGVADLVVAKDFDSLSSIYVAVLLGNGDGSFQAAQIFEAGYGPAFVAVGDFSGDGVQDLAVADSGSNTVSVLLGNGDGSFQAPRNFTAGRNPWSVAVGDFNGDGLQDLAVANSDLVFRNGNVSVLLGNGDGSFQAPRNFAAGSIPVNVAVGDFNGDGLQDLAVADSNLNNVSVLINNTPQ